MAFKTVNRRTFLGGAGAVAAAASLPLRSAHAQKTALTGVIWGGPWVEVAKKITAKQNKFDVRWELLQGGTAAIIPKIQATWPNVPYDFVAQFDPLYYTWDKADWAEPITFEEMPNLKDMPEEILFRNTKGQIIVVPLDNGASFWGYRKDICPVEIKTMEDLLNPKLKGKVIIRDASQGLNNNGVTYALAHGGSEHNMEPGWEFLLKLAKSGNIGRVGKTEVDFINSLTSGECVAAYGNLGMWGTVAKNFPCQYLIKDKKDAPGFQAIMFTEAFMIPRTSPNKQAAKEYLNWFVNAENNEEYSNAVNFAPANRKSKPNELAKTIMFENKEERAKRAYSIRYDVLSEMRDQMAKRFETDIVPHIK